jgi:[acyl-carrier-protein] S-malonyltransferase
MRAFVYPGQGSQYAGMGRDLAQSCEEARQTFQEADDALGFALSRLCFDGPEEELRLTENTQPAILALSTAVDRVLRKSGKMSDFVAGHSLGEYSALVAAASLTFGDALRLVKLRGRFMQEAVPVGVGAMAAVLGLDLPELQKVCRQAAEGQVVSAANINAPGQLVIAGHREAVERASRLALEKGARKAVPLPVSAPFHCELMLPAQERLAAAMQEVGFADLTVPLVNNVDAALITSGMDAREGLIRQVSSAVRWIQCVQKLVQSGVDTFVEVGPGKVLSGLIKRIAPDANIRCVGKVEEVEAYV